MRYDRYDTFPSVMKGTADCHSKHCSSCKDISDSAGINKCCHGNVSSEAIVKRRTAYFSDRALSGPIQATEGFV